MQLIDLSHTLQNGMPVFPGDSSPTFTKSLTHQKDGAQVIRMDLATHHGTHLDCPLHFIKNGKSADTSAIENFYGKALLVDCSAFNAGEQIPAGHFESLHTNWLDISWVVLYTGWYKYWGSRLYFGSFPVLSEEAAYFLVNKNIRGIGLDVISIDPVESEDFPIHNIILGNGLYIIENLTNLHEIKNPEFMLTAFPLKILDGDGSPVRAVAMI